MKEIKDKILTVRVTQKEKELIEKEFGSMSLMVKALILFLLQKNGVEDERIRN